VKPARQLRADEVEQLVEHYRQNGSVAAAAKALSITRQTAGKHLADAGISTLRRMTEANIADARSAHAAGASATAIGRKLGFSANTILKVVTGGRVA
jgi:DNA invertase Pin-like site-specific DNA recombinase